MVFFFETVCIILLRSSQKWHRLFSFFHPGGMSASSSETDAILTLGVSQKRHRLFSFFSPGRIIVSLLETDVIIVRGMSQKRHRGIPYILVMGEAAVSPRGGWCVLSP